MQILTTPPPSLDPDDIRTSFRAISDYLQQVMETIDFTLGKYGGALQSTADADTVQQLINGLRGTISSLQSGLSQTNTALTGINDELRDLDGRMNSLERQAEQTGKDLSDLTNRVETLEGGSL